MNNLTKKSCRLNPLYSLLVFATFMVHSLQSLAQNLEDITLDDLFTLSLEELSQVKVTTASIVPLSIEESPGVVRVFTQEDIARGGFETLADLMRHVPGVQVADSGRGTQVANNRGI